MMIEVTQEDGNNYCRILSLLGMEEEGDPVAEVERLLTLAAPPPSPAPAPQASDDMAAIYDAFGIGSGARSMATLTMCLSNVLRRSECLSAIERKFFMVPTEPEEEDDGVWGEECLLNWGHDPDQYAATFGEALKAIASPPPQPASAQTVAEAMKDGLAKRFPDDPPLQIAQPAESVEPEALTKGKP